MNCQSCREALTALIDEELGRDDQSFVESHLTSCPDCRKEYESLEWAFNLTEQVNSVPFNPALWTRIQSEITSERKGLGTYLKTLLVPRWRPIAAAVGTVAVAFILFTSILDTGTNPELEKEFTEFIQKREQTSRENRRMLLEPRSSRDHRGGNPFVRPVSYERTNPFRE